MISPSSYSDTLEATRPSGDVVKRAATITVDTAHDAELVRRFVAGDDDAFAEIIQRYRKKMFTVAFGLLRNQADAEEIAQDTFIRAYRGLATFRGDSSLATWLYRIALNLSRNRYWYFFRRKRHVTRSLDCAIATDSSSTYADLVASETACPAREATTREFSTLVSECMTKLSSHQCEILMMRNVRQCSYQHIARTLGISVGTVKSRIARARENLRKLLAETYAAPEPGTAPSSQWFESSQPVGACRSSRWSIATQ